MIRSFVEKAITRGHFHFFISNLVQQAVAFVTVIVVAKLLPEAQFASVRVAQTYLAVLLILGSAGITAPVLRYCADGKFTSIERRQIFGYGAKFALLVSVLLTLIAFLVVFMRYRHADTERLIFIGYAAQLPALVLVSIALVYVQALQQFRTLAVNQLFLKLLALFALTGGTYWFGLRGLVFSALMVAYISAWWILRVARPLISTARPSVLPVDFTSLAKYSVLGTLVSTLGQSSDLILLDALAVNKTAVGTYSLASIFLIAAGALIGTAQGVVTPAFTAVMNKPEIFRKQLRNWSIAMFSSGIVASSSILIVGWVLETWFFGGRYANFSGLLALLMIKFCLWSTYAIGGAALVGIGAIKKGSAIAIFTTILAFATGFPLISKFGIWGAAWAQVIVAGANFVLIWWVIRNEVAMLDTDRNKCSFPAGNS